MIVDLGEDPKIKDAGFIVSANIYSELANGYVKHWSGGEFTTYDEAYEYWDIWEPPSNEVEDFMKKERLNGDHSHYELEIGIFSKDPNEPNSLAFMNRTIDVEHEWRDCELSI